MAALDYGAILKKNGVILNKSLFEERDDIPEYVSRNLDDKVRLKGNYFVYAGDPNTFLVSFYKTHFVVSVGEKLLMLEWPQFQGQTYFINNISLTVELIDKSWHYEYIDDYDDDDIEFLQCRYGIQGARLRILRRAKQRRRPCYKYRGQKFIAKWEVDGDNYEVIFGYGIDPNIDVYNDIKNNSYDYTEKEIEFIDNWFQS